MPLIVTILGSGTCVPSLVRSSASMLVATDHERILVDIGCGTIHRLLAAGQPIHQITHLVLTHFHPDHTGDLAGFLFANKYPDHRQRRRPLTLMGGPGFNRFFKALEGAWGNWVHLGEDRLKLLELSGQGAAVFGETFRLDSAPVAHNPESLAYRITARDDGRCVVYSGDTDACESLETFACGADLFVCESALPDALKVAGHLTPSLAGRIATRAGVRRLVLTHLYPSCETVDLAAECRRAWSGPLTIAQDLMRIDLASGAEWIETKAAQ